MSYGIERRKALKSEIPTLRRVLKYYANRLTDLRDDPELRYENNFIRNDLFLAATSVQKILDLINKEAELVENFVAEARDTVESAFQCYVSDLEKARSLAHDKLKVPKLIFTETEKELDEVKGAKKLFLEESGRK